MPTEAGRHHLYETVKRAWGADDADELMSLLPPVGWADVATKQDLVLLGSELASRIDALRAEVHQEFARQHAAFGNQLRWMVGIVLTAFIGLTGVFAGIVNWMG